MGETLCQIVIVENTTGAGGTFLDALVRDRPSETRRRNSSRHLCGDQGPIRVLCHECRRSTRRRATVLEMKEGPSGSAIGYPKPPRGWGQKPWAWASRKRRDDEPDRHDRERRAQV